MHPWRTWGPRVGKGLQLLYGMSDRALVLCYRVNRWRTHFVAASMNDCEKCVSLVLFSFVSQPICSNTFY